MHLVVLPLSYSLSLRSYSHNTGFKLLLDTASHTMEPALVMTDRKTQVIKGYPGS